MKKLTFFLCAIFLTMVGFSHGNEVFADIGTARIDGGGTFSSFQGLTWSPNGQLTWTEIPGNRTLVGPGDTCIDPAVIGSLPFTVTDNTGNYGDDYSSADRPPLAPGAVGNPSANYLGGDDVVYSYTPSANGVINITVTNHAAWTGLFVFTGCPFASTVGGHTNSLATTDLMVESLPVTAGETYYIVISTWPSPQSTDYTLTVEEDAFDCPELEANIGDPCDDGDPNTIGDSINANCECVGIVPGPGADCAAAISLECNGDPVTYNSIGSTATNTTTCSMGNAGLWFTFTGTGNTITVNSTAAFDHEMSINTGSCENLTNITCKDGSTTAETYTLATTVAGQAYYVYIAHYASGNSTTGEITVSLVCATEFDCPELQKNIGDSCDLGGGETGIVDADCNCTEVSCQNTSKYPSAAITPNADGSPTQIASCTFYGEYSEIGGIISGYEYQFDAVASGTSGYITVREGSVGGPVVAKGYGPLTITAPSSSNLFVHWNSNDTCGTGSSCVVTTVSCITCASAPDCEGVPGGPAQPGTPCDDGDPNTYNDVYDENCNCAGVVPSPGDVCSMAISLECGVEAQTYSSANSMATNTTSCSMGAKGIWFSFVGTGADITVNSTATFDHEMSINTGSCDELVNIACRDGSTTAETYTVAGTVAGQTYYVYVAHYSSTSTTTGDITISLDCAVVPECVPPTITAYASDETGEPISGCLEAGDLYYIYATLEGGEGNSSYYVSANGGDAVEVDANDSVNLGPFTVGSNVTVNAVGVQDGDCSVSASVTSPAICPPSNDDCDNAIQLACGQPITGSTVNATASGLPATCNGYTSSSALDVFYSFEADGTSDYTVSLDAATGNSFDGILFIYSGACGELTSLGCSDSGNPEEMELIAPAAGTYIVRVYRYTSSGNFTLSLECSAAPACESPLGITVDNVTADSADITWSPANSGDNQWEISLTVGGQGPDEGIIANVSGTPEYTATGLDPDTTYNVYLRTICSDEESSEWAFNGQFTTLEAETPCESPLGITVDNVTADSADITWSPANSGDNQWEISLTVGGQGPDEGIIASVSGTPEYTATGLDPDTTYYVYLRTICSDEESSEWAFNGQFTTLEAETPCESPLGITVDNVTADSADITWSPANSGDNQWEISLTVGGQGPDEGIIASVSGTPEYTATGLDPDTTYYVYLRTICSDEESSEWAFNGDFTTLEAETPCESPLGITVDNVTADSADITWSPANSGDNQWEISLTVGGQGPDEGIIASVSGTPEYTATGLDPDTTYYVYLRTICSDEESSEWAFNGQFTTMESQEPGCEEGAFVTTWRTSANDELITIPTYSGETYNYTVVWGDGSSNTNVTGDISHSYADAGTYTVSICGTFPRIYLNNEAPDRGKLRTIEQWGNNVWTSMNGAFAGAENMVSNATDMPNLSMVTDMYGMFAFARSFNGDANIGNWDVSNVIDMYGMFAGASVFNADINNWDVSNVTTMENMFYGATVFRQDLGSWNVGNVNNMRNMFSTAMLFNGDISNWNVSNVTTMYGMFFHANQFNRDLGNWDVSNVTDMRNMLKNVKLSVANYDSLLMGWSTLTLQPNVIFNAGKSKYCAGEMARQSIIANYNWTIQDQGLDCTLPGPKDIENNASLANVTLYPNPMVNNLTLSNPMHVNIEKIAIYDLTGRMVKSVDLKGMTSDATLDVSHLSSATYMVIISGDSGQVSKLLIKE